MVAEAACFSEPLVVADGELRAGCWVATEPAALVLDTIKRSEDDEALVLRLYESRGSRGTGLLRLAMPVAEIVSANFLEEPRESLEVTSEGIAVPLHALRADYDSSPASLKAPDVPSRRECAFPSRATTSTV